MKPVRGLDLMLALGKGKSEPKAEKSGTSEEDADRAAQEFINSPSCKTFMACLQLCQDYESSESSDEEASESGEE